MTRKRDGVEAPPTKGIRIRWPRWYDAAKRFHFMGRDYEATLAGTGVAEQHPQASEPGKPCLTQVLDSRAKSGIGGRFWIPSGAKELRGMAVKVSRVGQPGPLEVRFGSRPGSDDLGVARLDPKSVLPDKEAWCELRIDPRPVEPGTLVHYDVGCTSGTAPQDHYVVYGPRPIGGKEWPNLFALSYRVFTDRPQDAAD